MDLLTPCCKRKNFPAIQRGCGCRRLMCRPRVFATMSVFARTVFASCLRTPTCLRATCLGEVSSPAHVSSRRSVSSHAHVSSLRGAPSPPDLSSATVFSREHGFTSGSALVKAVRSGSVLQRPRVFALGSVFAGSVSSDAHVSSLSSLGMCLLTPRCLRRPCFEASVLDPTRLQNVSSVFGQYVHAPGDRNVIYIYNAPRRTHVFSYGCGQRIEIVHLRRYYQGTHALS